MSKLPTVACISLEAWDETWRRNQHFAKRLVAQGYAGRIVFVEPPILGRGPRRWSPQPGIYAVRPPLWLPKRARGLQAAGAWLRHRVLRDIDVAWVNDPTLGIHCLRAGADAVYDVTDDLRTFEQPPHITARIVSAENRLASRARTVVCSAVLAERWLDRYDIKAAVVRNAVDLTAFASATPLALSGSAPHIGYVGTLHAHRLDLALVQQLAQAGDGTVHLVGPDSLEPADRARLIAQPRIRLEGAVATADVPRWMKAMDVLVCPHLVNPFTLSLDAIKSHEYIAAARPVVATPTSGFQSLAVPGVLVVDAPGFVAATLSAVGASPPSATDAVGWDERTHDFATALLGPQ
jgi:teichuronic acid biosynthesis glycosyltransferase TuaH